MQVILAQQPQVPLLYFSLQGWESATKDLADVEVDEVLLARLDRWSPNALEHVPDWIAQNERGLLTLTAQALREASDSDREVLQTHFDRALTLLSDIAAQGRYEDMKWTELFTIAQEKDALLIAELPNVAEKAVRKEFAKELSGELVKLGRSEFAEALPFTDPSRGVWVTPFDESIRTWLSLRGLARVSWRDGVVATVPLRHIQQFRQEGKEVVVLYAEPGSLMQDMHELTRTQLRHRFEQLSIIGEAGRTRQMDDYLNGRRLDAALLRRAMHGRAIEENSRLAEILAHQVDTETTLLSASLSRVPPRMAAGGKKSLVASLRRGEEELSLEVQFFIELSQARHDEELRSLLSTILKTKASDIDRIDKLKD